jgi:hypothetical protein
LRRLAAALAAVTAGLLASAGAIPAAFAAELPPAGGGYQLGRFGPVPATTSHVVATGGITGWQITLITLIALGAAAAVAVTVWRHRARGAHRAAPSPAA